MKKIYIIALSVIVLLALGNILFKEIINDKANKIKKTKLDYNISYIYNIKKS